MVGCGGSDDTSAVSPGPGGADKGPHACTEIGCTSGLSLNVGAIRRKLPQAEQVNVCLRRRCHRYSLAKTRLVTLTTRGLDEGQRVAVRLVVFDGRGKVLLRRHTRAPVIKTKPNGPNCPPTCFQVRVRLDPQTLRLVVD